MTDDRTRRTVLLAAAAGLTGLAGCVAPRREPRPGGGGTGSRETPHAPGDGPHDQRGTRHHGGRHGGPMGPATRRGTRTPGDNFDGVADRTGRATVTVQVGAEGNGGYYAFEPPAVRVSRGTTVRWAWTGKGGAHDVIARDGRFESERATSDDTTFSRTFETTGTHRYYCTPHRSLGMKGAIVVV